MVLNQDCHLMLANYRYSRERMTVTLVIIPLTEVSKSYRHCSERKKSRPSPRPNSCVTMYLCGFPFLFHFIKCFRASVHWYFCYLRENYLLITLRTNVSWTLSYIHVKIVPGILSDWTTKFSSTNGEIQQPCECTFSRE